MSRHFHPIPARAHATPTTTVIFSRVVEEKHTGVILTFLNEGEVAVRKQIAGGLGYRQQKMPRLIEVRVNALLKSASRTS